MSTAWGRDLFVKSHLPTKSILIRFSGSAWLRVLNLDGRSAHMKSSKKSKISGPSLSASCNSRWIVKVL